MATQRKVISAKNWRRKLGSIKIRKEDVNKLVMNFLLTVGYVDAAEKFYTETGTEHIDLTAVADRMTIKRAAESGNFEEAIEKIKVLNPEILDTPIFFFLQQQRMIELIRNGKTTEALDIGKEVLAPMGLENEFFLEETERTVSLIAFVNAANNPLHELLDTSRSLKLASYVNAAILTSQGLEKDPKILTLLRMLLLSQSELLHLAIYPVITSDFLLEIR